MATIDYKEKYEKAVQAAMLAKQDTCSAITIGTLETIFPELRESEDERIRQAIINVFATHKDYEIFFGASVEDILAWLEKQGEQKPAYKVEPKFHEGEWVVFNNKHESVYQVERIDNYRYYLRHYLGGTLSVHFDNELIRPWTIQDAKDGDVLVDDLGNNCIYQEPSTKLMYHSYCYGNHKCFIDSGGSHVIVGTYPATKEQRDTLMNAMAEAGYTFDFEKKELKKIEQKPADLKTKAGNWYICDMEVINENMETAFHRDEIYYCPKDGYLDVGGALFKVGCLDVFRLATEKEIPQPQPKQEWSEKDEKIKNALYKFLNGEDALSVDGQEAKCWLNNLKERVQPQPKQEWSEEDDENLNWFEKFFRAESVIAEGKDIPQDRYLWFKNLKGRLAIIKKY